MARTGVVLTNLGGPDVPASIEPFLFNLFSDPLILSIRPAFLRRFVARKISRGRAPKVAKDYARIGGASPLPRLTDVQAKGLEALLEARAPGRYAVAVAMRYWKPFTEEAVEALLARGCDRFLHLPLYPQESRATTESSSLELRRVLSARAGGAPFEEIRSYHLHPGYVAAVRRTLDEALATMRATGTGDVHVLFSAHGLPERFERRGDPYVGQIRATREAVAKGLDAPTSLSFQSRVGPVAWVAPYTDETIDRLASEGVKALLFVPLGFVSDHFETLYEIDLLYGERARAKGIERVARAPSLNDRPDFLATLADLVQAAPGLADAEVSTVAHHDLVVVGAGLTGLSTAWRARQAGRSVVLLEASPRVGGVVRTDRVGAYRVERAAGSFPSTSTALLELHAGLARAPAIHKPDAAVNAQFLATRRGLVALPRGGPAFLASPLLTPGQKLRLVAEITRGPRRSGPAESLHAFVRRRFGTAVAERFLKPFTLGVYGTAPEDLGAADAFPTLPAAERASGSLLLHLGKKKPGSEARTPRSRLPWRRESTVRRRREAWTFEGGMEELPRAIAEDLRDVVRLSTSVGALRRDGNAVALTTASGEEIRASEVVLATPAPEQARLVAAFSSAAAAILVGVSYAPMVVTSVGLPPDSARLVPKAFGFLRAPGAPLRILGASFPSNLDPAVAPAGHALANVFVGGGRDPGAVALSDDEIRAVVVRDLSTALGGPIVPDLVTIHRWPRAIPMFTIGHRARMAEAQRLVAPYGVRLSGSHVTGVGVHACCTPLPV